MGLKKKPTVLGIEWTDEITEAYLYCVKNNIIISPVAVKDTIGSWAVGISLPGNLSLIHISEPTSPY